MNNKLPAAIGVTVILVIAVWNCATTPTDAEYEALLQKYTSTHKVIIRGKVRKTWVIDHGCGILYLDSIRSTIPYFSPFDLKENVFMYYVKGNVAELYISGLGAFMPGDSVVFNTNTDSLYSYRAGVVYNAWSLGLFNTDHSWGDDYYGEIKKVHGAKY